jgi:hypothetical protein
MLCTQEGGARASGSHTTMLRSMDETKGHEETTPHEVTSGNMKLRWFQETLKEAKEYVGEPQRLMRESRALEVLFVLGHGDEHHRFRAHYFCASNRSGERPCRRSMTPLCAMMCGRWSLDLRGSQR